MLHPPARPRPILPTSLALLGVLVLGACGPDGTDSSAEASADGPDQSPEEMAIAALEDQVVRGESVYQEVCSTCHSMEPPPELAPPFTHVAGHIRQATEDREAFLRHVVEYVASPDAERSLLPTRAVERFGLMPAQEVTPAQLADVAAYLWVLADSAQGGMDHEPGEGMGGNGMGGNGMGGNGMGGNGMGGNGMGGAGMGGHSGG